MIDYDARDERRGLGFSTADINDISDQTSVLKNGFEEDLDAIKAGLDIRPGKEKVPEIPQGETGYVLGELVVGPYVRETGLVTEKAAKACMELTPERFVYLRKDST